MTNLVPIHALQDGSILTAVARKPSKAPQAPILTYSFLNASSTAPTTLIDEVVQRLQLTARVAPYNPPEVVADQPDVTRIMNMAGISHGHYTTPATVNLTAAVYGLRAGSQTSTSFLVQNNGWYQSDPATQGDFLGDYVSRSTVAFSNHLEQVPAEALYPIPDNASALVVGADATSVGAGALPIGANQSILLTFDGGKPPVRGYWSLTAYDDEGYLVENSLNRVSIGSRSQITYAAGTPVYGGNSSQEVFQILIQPADVTPPSNWTSK